MTVRDRDSLVKTYSIPCVIIHKVFIAIVINFSTQSFNQSKILQNSIYVYKIIPIKYLRYQIRNSLKPFAVSKQNVRSGQSRTKKNRCNIKYHGNLVSPGSNIFCAVYSIEKKEKNKSRANHEK